MIVYYTPGGRLGNQIFQLAFLLSVASPGEICVISRMESALGLFKHGLKTLHIPKGPLYKIFDKIVVPLLLKPLCRLRVVTFLFEEAGRLTERRGILSGIRVVSGYFQSESFVKAAVNGGLEIKPLVSERARAFLKSIGAAAECKPVFVHVRRTDYLDYDILGKKNPSLPLSYYEKTIQWFIDNIDKPCFIFLGDDPEFVYKQLSWVVEKHISHNDARTDFALMTLCAGAVLSNSSLAWWGARFMRNPVKVFAPKYWLGWKSRRWYPEEIRPAFAECVDVE
jgi:hypothetical protein